MIEWIIAAAVGTPLLIGLGIALFKEDRKIRAMHEAADVLDLDLIHTDVRFPRLEGHIDEIPLAVYRKYEGRSGRLVAQADPRGLPPEVDLVMTGIPSEKKRRRMEKQPPRARIESIAKLESSNQDVLDALLDHEAALEALWSLHCRHPHVSFEFGEIVVRLGDFAEASELIETLQDVASHAMQLEAAFEQTPIVVH